MDVSQITALIGAAASLLCTIVVGALTFFMKKTLASLEEDYIRVMNRVEDKLDQILYGGKAKGKEE